MSKIATIVDDEISLLIPLRYELEYNGWEVRLHEDATAAYNAITRDNHAAAEGVLVVDLMLAAGYDTQNFPFGDATTTGLTLVERLHAAGALAKFKKTVIFSMMRQEDVIVRVKAALDTLRTQIGPDSHIEYVSKGPGQNIVEVLETVYRAA